MALPLFSTIITPAQFTSGNNNTVLSLALGITSMVICKTTASIAFLGLTAIGGNVDGMVVTIQLINAGSFSLSFSHDASTPATSGFLNSVNASTTTGSAFGAVTYRYLAGTTNRWLHIGKV